MPASEIDEIFASTRNAKTPLVNEISLTSKKKSKKTSKTLAPTREVSSASDAPPSSKRLHPETIEDPSLQFKRNTEPPSQSMCRTKMSHKKMKMSKDNEERFKNSRGTARRKTEDGYSIYKEDELGISTEGGDTPLCPFDCSCCF